jgi:hypothetical protein
MRAEELPPLAWRKAQRSMSNGACVEVAPTAAGVVVRDSKDPDGLVIGYAHQSWKSFVMRAQSGSFDFPCCLSRTEAPCSVAFCNSRLYGMPASRRRFRSTERRRLGGAGDHRQRQLSGMSRAHKFRQADVTLKFRSTSMPSKHVWKSEEQESVHVEDGTGRARPDLAKVQL